MIKYVLTMYSMPGPVLGTDKAVSRAARDPILELRTQQGDMSQPIIDVILWLLWCLVAHRRSRECWESARGGSGLSWEAEKGNLGNLLSLEEKLTSKISVLGWE